MSDPALLNSPFLEIANRALFELGQAGRYSVVSVSHDHTGCCARLKDLQGREAAVCVEWTTAQPVVIGVSLFKNRMRALNLA